jgi:uncharacterized membrane protein
LHQKGFNEELGLERLVFFSDAVMAIAITLLILDLKVPELSRAQATSGLPGVLYAQRAKFFSFVLSFAVIGLYWRSHLYIFGYIRRFDSLLIVLNLLFLLFIAMLPFVTSLLGEYGDLPFPNILYAITIAACGASLTAIWFYASHRHRLIDPDLDQRIILSQRLRTLAAPIMFLASILLASINPAIMQTSWWISAVLAILIYRRIIRSGH